MWVSEVVPLGPHVLGFDILQKVAEADLRMLAAAGLAFGVRYVDLVEGTTPVTLDPAELDTFGRVGVPLMTVQFARSSGWSLATGTNDGRAAAHNHIALGLPNDGTLSCDLEGKFSSVAQCVDYGSAWYEAALRAGMNAQALQVYVGAGVPLNSAELFHDLPFEGYWKSGSRVPDVDVRGYRMIQVPPLDQIIGDKLQIDLDVVLTDFENGRPRWMRSSDALPTIAAVKGAAAP